MNDMTNTVEVVDRGAREIVVFLSGQIDAELSDPLHAAVEHVVELVELNGLDHVVVDMHRVEGIGEAGVSFLRELIARGGPGGFAVSFAALSAAAHREIEAAGWSFQEHSPQLPQQRRGGSVVRPSGTHAAR